MEFLTNITDKTEIKVGVGVLVLGKDNTFLLEKRKDCGLWGLLGGKVDVGESLEEAAIREVKEESGLDVKIENMVGVYSHSKDRIIKYDIIGDEKHLIDVIFTASVFSGNLQISDESETLQYFNKENVPKDAEIIPPSRQPLFDFIKGKINVIN